MKPALFILFALFLTASCGKKEVKKKSSDLSAFTEASYVDDIESFMPQLRAVFADQFITDHFNDDAELIFVEMRTNTIIGKSFNSLKDAFNCSHYFVRPNSAVLLTVSTNINTCLTPASQTSTELIGDYNIDLIPDLKIALDGNPDRITIHEITYEGQTYVGFGIQKDSAFNLSNDYIEYVVIPDFPLILNPVLTYDSQSGVVRALKGIQVN